MTAPAAAAQQPYRPTRAQIDACKAVADAMHVDVIDKRTQESKGIDYASGNPHFQLEFHPVRLFSRIKWAIATAEEAVEAKTDPNADDTKIEICIPSRKQSLAKSADQQFDTVRRVIAGAIVHELVHATQRVDNPVAFSDALRAARWLHQQPNLSDVSPNAWLTGYYDVPAEFEAHAVQAAAEVYYSIPSDADGADFKAAFDATPLVARITPRMGPEDEPDWWKRFAEEAEDVYSHLVIGR